MNYMKLFAASAAFLGALASSAVHAHASFTIGGAAGAPDFINGDPVSGVEYPAYQSNINIPSIAFAGIHGATASNNRIIETGVYNSAANVSNTQLGGSFNGIATSTKNTLLGQLYTYNTAATADPNNATVSPTYAYNGGTNQLASGGYNESVAVTQGSWGNGVSSIYNSANNTFNQGNLYINPYAGSGSTASSPNGEYNIIQSTGAQYLNVSIAADNYAVTGTPTAGVNAGTNELAYAIYQGVATGPGLQGLVLLGSGTASAPGAEIDFSVHMTGSYLNGPVSGGEFTLVVGDASQSTNSTLSNYVAASSFDPYVKIGLWETGAGSANTIAGLQTNSGTIYQEQGTNPSAVPVPGAVWLFGSALAGFAGFGRRKQTAA